MDRQINEWLEASKENFDEALSLRNFDHAKAVIDDIADAGFAKEAIELGRILLAKKMTIHE